MARLPEADPLLILATVLAAGLTLGWLATRMRLPGVTGQILAGVLLGPSALHLFDADSVGGLEPLTHFALALIGVTVGAHLNLRRLRNAGRRLVWLLVAEAFVTPLVVAALLWPVTRDTPILALLLGTLAVSTAPATVIALVRETRSRGVFVKTLVAAVALNNIACIFLFELARSAGHLATESPLVEVSLLAALGRAGVEIASALALGAAMGVGVHLATLRVVQPDRLATLSALSLLGTFGLASWAQVSPLAAALALGVVQTNLAPSRDRLVDAVFADFEPLVLCVFFTLAGMHLALDHVAEVGVLAGLFVVGRFVAKVGAARGAMRLARAPARVRENLGLALVPQAGVAVGLVILIQDDAAFAAVEQVFTAVVLSAVTVNEIVGPIATRVALTRSGEAGSARPRLVDFLQEENITTELSGRSMEDAIAGLVDLLVDSHELDHQVDRDALLRSVLERETQVSTCLGEGLAVPHGELPEGLPMVGVMGISAKGLDLPTPDGRPVHCMVLLATPAGERDRHLEVLATLARTVGSDPLVQERLYHADSPAHVCEILHGEDTEDFNYFLEGRD